MRVFKQFLTKVWHRPAKVDATRVDNQATSTDEAAAREATIGQAMALLRQIADENARLLERIERLEARQASTAQAVPVPAPAMTEPVASTPPTTASG